MIQTQQMRMCDVCRLVDYDASNRLCFYCSMCDAWICQECAPQWGRRLKAALKRRMEPGFTGDPTYSDRLNEKGELLQ